MVQAAQRPAIRSRYDQLAKQALSELLRSTGPVETEREVAPEPQRIDVWFTPAAARIAKLRALGLLGRIAARPCALEAFHKTPGPRIAATCLRKHVHLCHHLALGCPRARPPRTWILSAGRPTTVLDGYGYCRARGWPAGIYVSPRLLTMGIVVISELPERRDTLLLRLIGAGATLRRAIDDVLMLPEDAVERRVMLPLLMRHRLTVPANPGRRTAEDKEFLMSTQDAYAVWEEKTLERGAQRGVEQGIERALVPARRFLLELYESRFGAAPTALRARVDATKDPDLMMKWSKLVVTAPRSEVDRELADA